MAEDQLDDFEKAFGNQKRIGEHLKALDPVLGPLEDFAKLGVSLAAGFVGITATVVGVLRPGQLNHGNDWILFISWVFFLAAIAFGVIELYRSLKFRICMRILANIMHGAQVDKKKKKECKEVGEYSQGRWLIAEFVALMLGVLVLLTWALIQMNSRVAVAS